jgi:hypothetical protein
MPVQVCWLDQPVHQVGVGSPWLDVDKCGRRLRQSATTAPTCSAAIARSLLLEALEPSNVILSAT